MPTNYRESTRSLYLRPLSLFTFASPELETWLNPLSLGFDLFPSLFTLESKSLKHTFFIAKDSEISSYWIAIEES